MLVKERMKALGDHAKSSRQPPVKERKYAKADESAAKQDVLDENILENGATHESAVAVLADDVTRQIAARKIGNDDAVAEVPSSKDAGEIATAAPVTPEAEPRPATVDGSTTQASAIQEDDATSAAKRAIIHEWENWSALHSDELNDPNVTKYFVAHLGKRKPNLFNFAVKQDDAIRKLTARGSVD